MSNLSNPLNLQSHSTASAPARLGVGLALFSATAVLAMGSVLALLVMTGAHLLWAVLVAAAALAYGVAKSPPHR